MGGGEQLGERRRATARQGERREGRLRRIGALGHGKQFGFGLRTGQTDHQSVPQPGHPQVGGSILEESRRGRTARRQAILADAQTSQAEAGLEAYARVLRCQLRHDLGGDQVIDLAFLRQSLAGRQSSFAENLQQLDADLVGLVAQQVGHPAQVGEFAVTQAHAPAPERMDPGQGRLLRVAGDGEHLRPRAEPIEAERGVDPHALIGVPKQAEQALLREGRGERQGEDFLRDRVRLGGHVHAPDRALAVEGVAPDPVGEIGAAIGSPGHPDAHEAGVDRAQARHPEPVGRRLQGERVHLAVRELVQDEVPTEGAVQGVARFEEEARRAVGIIRDGGRDRERLIGGAGRHPLVFAHPAARGLLVLVLVAPAGVRTFQEVHQPFAFLRLIPVVVHADDVAERIEGDLLRIADPAGEDLEAPAIRLAAEHGALVGEEETPALPARDITALVADGPIDAAVGAEA